jgi:hypothetical protein
MSVNVLSRQRRIIVKAQGRPYCAQTCRKVGRIYWRTGKNLPISEQMGVPNQMGAGIKIMPQSNEIAFKCMV